MTAFPGMEEPDFGAPPPGSAYWHALLFTPESRRKDAAAVLACRREIADTVRNPRDDNVARVRLGWWHEEIGLLAQGRPRHPATRQLAPALERTCSNTAPLAAMIAAARCDLERRSYAELDDLERHCADDTGACYELLATIAAPARDPDEAALGAARRIGAGAGMIGVIRRLHQDATIGRCYLPASQRDKLGIADEELVTAPPSEPLRKALAQVAERAHGALAQGFALLPQQDREICVTVLVLAALDARLLLRMEKERFDVIGKWTELAPAIKLWTAWNAARRAHRGRLPRCRNVAT